MTQTTSVRFETFPVSQAQRELDEYSNDTVHHIELKIVTEGGE